MTVHVFGIRHHGPGSARSLVSALEALAPDAVLVEGPPDAEGILPLAAHPEMKPPVAMLVYASDEPRRASFYPFAVFSPEWQAIRFALARGVAVRFIDLPQANALAANAVQEKAAPHDPASDEDPGGDAGLFDDPIGELSRAAGYDDREAWWEHQIEQRQDPRGVFEGILEAISVLRAGKPPSTPREAQREAHMRRVIRAAEKQGFARIAVVCGAWHAPALVERTGAKADDAVLKGLPKTKVEATWIPWTYGRLAFASGYGAGVASPGWYEHLWTARDKAAIHWAVRVAQLLRGAHLDASSASVIETVRLADALAAVRDRSMPGIADLNEAAQAVLCGGESAPMALIRERLVVGGELGEVPAEAPAVPLQRDLAAAQKSLRMKPSPEKKILDLDLRNDTDRSRSRLLHRLALLDVPWGVPAPEARRGEGTFHEVWAIEWRPELALGLVEANVYGNTVESAATAKAVHLARESEVLAELTALLGAVLVSELVSALDPVLQAIDDRSLASDVLRLMAALPDLVRASRYGTVRETRADQLRRIVVPLCTRVVLGLPGACASLDDDAAAAVMKAIRGMNEAVALFDDAEVRADWTGALDTLGRRAGVHALVRGGVTRLLVEQRRIDAADLERMARLELSPAVPARDASAWLEGLVGGSAQLLLHHDGVWSALDVWLGTLNEEAFVEHLPLVRRAFASFGATERRTMGEKARSLGHGAARARSPEEDFDPVRAALVLPVLSTILGVPIDAAH